MFRVGLEWWVYVYVFLVVGGIIQLGYLVYWIVYMFLRKVGGRFWNVVWMNFSI